MTKPKTVQDLMVSEIMTLRDVDRIACRLFSSGREMTTIIDGYVVTMPDFVELPDHIQQFIRKAISTATVVNLLDREEMKLEEHDLPVEDYDAEAKAFDSIVDEHFGTEDPRD